MLSACGLDTDDPDRGIHLLQVAADAADRAAGADTGKEIVDVARRLAPDFGPGRVIVRSDVELALVLVGAHVLAVICLALDHALDHAACAFRREDRAKLVFDLDQLDAEKTQHGFLLLRHALRYRDFDRRALCIGQGSQRDAGIARGRLDQRLAFLELQAPEHELRRAVLDRTERVHALELEQQVEVGMRIEALADAQHRRRVVEARDQVGDALVDLLFVVEQFFGGRTHEPQSIGAKGPFNQSAIRICYTDILYVSMRRPAPD